ncbi:head-tail joining protein [Minwuia thermotolerans]|uniref:Uncharacterized protein n=1 Tax=Minwuia thermotolerans TaxID=2056226 RepID=A0A2M9G2L0_9PROT|nr:hypothetical protein [Minwuia thermotolerans]PJK29951.1 hypothetical protein CVT23_09290 [Minwuia thermotolerans]
MTDAFAAAMATIFRDPNIGVSAVVWPAAASVLDAWDGVGEPDLGDAGAALAVRAALSTPDSSGDLYGLGVVREAPLADIPVEDAPALAAADVLQIGSTYYALAEAPRRDALGLVWRAPLRAGRVASA